MELTQKQKEALVILGDSGLLSKTAGIVSQQDFDSLVSAGYASIHKNNMDYRLTDQGWEQYNALTHF